MCRFQFARVTRLFLAATILTSCKGDGATAPGSLTLVVAPATVTVAQGNTAQVTATLTRSNYGGTVTFSVADAPAGVTANVGTAQTSGNNTTVSVTIVVGPNATPGTYTLEMSGSGSGVNAASNTFTLVVTPAGTFGLTIASAEQLSLKQGLSDNSRTVSITRTNYNGPVTLTAENLPTGVTATFANNPATGNNAVLSLTAAVEAPVGTSTITIKGTGPASGTNPGLPPVVATATLQLAITTAGSFMLSVEPSPTLTLTQGTTNNSRTINIARTEFTSPITLEAENLPEGVTASFSPNPADANSAQLTLTASSNAAVGAPVTVTIRGSGPVAFGQGVATSTIEASTTLQLTVAPAPDFALSVNPSSATIEQGQSRSDIAVSVARTAFDGPVTLGLTGDVPNGVTAGFAPAAPTNGSSVLSIAVDAATPTGTYALAISGNGAPGARTVPFTLTVAPAPPPAGTFTLSMPAPCAQNFRLRQGAIDDRRLVVIERDNLPNAIQFSVEGLPAGVTANFDANPVTGNSVRIIFIAASDATPGNHPVTLRGIVPGGNPVTLPFMIEVHEVDPFEDDLDATNFDFTGGSTGGWRRGVVCPEGNDDFGGVILQDDMIVMGGRGPASGRTEPNAWMTRLVRLPANATVFRFDASAHHIAFCGNFCRTRVRVRVFEGTTSTTLLDETIEWIAEGLVFEPYNADVSPWAGKVVRLIIEHLDPDASHVQLWLDTFRIL